MWARRLTTIPVNIGTTAKVEPNNPWNIFYSTVYSGTDQRKHQSSASLDFVWGIHRSPVNSPHKGPVTRKTFPFYDVIMRCLEIFVMNDGRNDARWLYYQRVIEDITKMWSIYTVTLCSQNIRTVVFLYFVFWWEPSICHSRLLYWPWQNL